MERAIVFLTRGQVLRLLRLIDRERAENDSGPTTLEVRLRAALEELGGEDSDSVPA